MFKWIIRKTELIASFLIQPADRNPQIPTDNIVRIYTWVFFWVQGFCAISTLHFIILLWTRELSILNGFKLIFWYWAVIIQSIQEAFCTLMVVNTFKETQVIFNIQFLIGHNLSIHHHVRNLVKIAFQSHTIFSLLFILLFFNFFNAI